MTPESSCPKGISVFGIFGGELGILDGVCDILDGDFFLDGVFDI